MTSQKDIVSKRHFELFLYLDINMRDLLVSKIKIQIKLTVLNLRADQKWQFL